MRVLMLSSERNVLREGSKAQKRLASYGSVVEQLDVIVFSTKAHKLQEKDIASNVRVYPTDSRSRWFYILDAVRLDKRFSSVDVVTAQDPFEIGLAGWLIARRLRARL